MVHDAEKLKGMLESYKFAGSDQEIRDAFYELGFHVLGELIKIRAHLDNEARNRR